MQRVGYFNLCSLSKAYRNYKKKSISETSSTRFFLKWIFLSLWCGVTPIITNVFQCVSDKYSTISSVQDFS
jgi:hypothetical protein